MTKATEKAKQKTNTSLPSLHNWNVWLAIIHALQGAVILLLSTTKLFPIETQYLTTDPSASELAGHSVLAQATHHLFDLNLAYLVAAIFFVSAAAHAFAATAYRQRYEADLKKKVNKLRWIEYSLSASLVIVAMAVLSGVASLSLLITLVALEIVMHLLGLAMEVYNQGKAKPNWLAYFIGIKAGFVPWLVFAIYVWGANLYGNGSLPSFVYWIYLTMFLMFGAFAANMYLQYKKTGQWKDYLYGERVFMILSVVAKTLLAWQIFAGALRP